MSKKLNKSKQVRGGIAGPGYITHEHEVIATLAAIIYTTHDHEGGERNAVKIAHAILREAQTVDAEVLAVAADAARESQP